MDDINLLLILSAGIVTTASPGPSTLAIIQTFSRTVSTR